MTTMLYISNVFPVSIDLGGADITRSAAEAAQLTFHPNQEPTLDRIRRLNAAIIVQLEQLRDSSTGAAADTARMAITYFQTAGYWGSAAVIAQIRGS